MRERRWRPFSTSCLADGGKEGLELDSQTEVSAHPQAARKKDRGTIELPAQDGQAILARHGKDHVGIWKRPFLDRTDAVLDRQMILAAFRPAQVELVHDFEALRRFGVELLRQHPKELLD